MNSESDKEIEISWLEAIVLYISYGLAWVLIPASLWLLDRVNRVLAFCWRRPRWLYVL